MRLARSVAPCLLAAACIAVAACGSSDDAPATKTSGAAATTKEKPVKVGLFLPSVTNEFWKAIKYGAEQEASRLGVELVVQASTDDSNASAGIGKVQNLITQGAQAIVIVPLADTFKPVLEKAEAQHVPVICVNGCVKGWTGYTSFIQTNNQRAGELAGEFIGTTMDGAGVVGMLNCYAGVPSCDERISGARAKLGSAITVKGPLDVKCDRQKAVSATQNLMTANPGMKVLYSTCGQASLAALNVIAKSGKDIKVVSVDGTAEEAASIKAGKLLATIAQHPVTMGTEGVKQAVAAVRGQAVTKEIDSGEDLVTKDNVDAFVETLPPATS
jgi:ribose transport system substrate-binding protein